jgi:phosphoglycerol transferase
MISTSFAQRILNIKGLLALLPLVFLYLLFRNQGLFPVVMADEWTYNYAARLLPLAESPLPSYLYLGLFGSTSACGPAFLSCARMLNVLLFLASAPLIYSVARSMVPAPAAVGLALLAVLGPVNSYTAYFMPEASYFTGFWLVTWCVLRFHQHPSPVRAVAVGAALGILALVKVHAMFLLAPVLLTMAWSAWTAAPASAGQRLQRMAGAVLLVFGTALLLRFGIGYLVAGSEGLSLMGKLYREQSEWSVKLRKPPAQLLELALGNLQGHVLGLALLAGLPLAALLAEGAGKLQRAAPAVDPAGARQRSGFALYTALTLMALVAVTALFTASVAGNGPHETIARLHLRYYDFALPLLPLFAASQLYGEAPARTLRVIAALVLAAIMAAAALTLGKHFTPSSVDSPELRGLMRREYLMHLLSALALAALLWWQANPQKGVRLFLLAFLPLYTLAASWQVNTEVRSARHPDLYDRAGVMVHQRLAPAALDQLRIVGVDHGGLLKVRFHANSAHSVVLPTAEGSMPDLAKLEQPGWLLMFGNYPLPPYAVPRVQEDGFTLYQLVQPQHAQRIDFRAPLEQSVLAASSGIGVAEAWGRWSEGPQIRLEFKAALPARVTLRLTGRAFGPNAGKDVVVQVGERRQVLRMTEEWQSYALQFDNGGGERTVVLNVPNPVTPKQLGLGDDGRALGLALVRMDVGALPLAEPQQDKVAYADR